MELVAETKNDARKKEEKVRNSIKEKERQVSYGIGITRPIEWSGP